MEAAKLQRRRRVGGAGSHASSRILSDKMGDRLWGLEPSEHVMLWGPILGFALFVQIAKLLFTQGSRSSLLLVRFSGAHNLILAIFSGAVTVFGVKHLLLREQYSVHGWLCATPTPAPRLIFFWYASKFYEWIDTALLLARGKALSSLHFNHHMTAATVVASHMVGRGSHAADRTSIYDVPLLLNAFVHTLMCTQPKSRKVEPVIQVTFDPSVRSEPRLIASIVCIPPPYVTCRWLLLVSKGVQAHSPMDHQTANCAACCSAAFNPVHKFYAFDEGCRQLPRHTAG